LRLPRDENDATFLAVIPAKQGIQSTPRTLVDSRLRDERPRRPVARPLGPGNRNP